LISKPSTHDFTDTHKQNFILLGTGKPDKTFVHTVRYTLHNWFALFFQTRTF